MQAINHDIAIIGGGLAGLLLAAELCDTQFSALSIVVIEPREEYKRDKTWSYWRTQPHKYSALETATWQRWRLTHNKKSVQNWLRVNQDKINLDNTKKAESYCYASIPSDAFYKTILEKIKACRHIKIMQGEMVESLRTEASSAIITLKSRINIEIKQAIFDSRPPINDHGINKNKYKKAQLNQHFFGVELLSDDELFDESCIDLMDFQPSNQGIHFMYVLPFTKSHALVESTWINKRLQHDDYTIELNNYLNKRWPNAQFKIAYTEKGSLPLKNMTSCEYRLGNVQVIAIGTAAGLMRAATGYAFLETLADSQRLANLIATNKQLIAFKRCKIERVMDFLFLSFLSKNNAIGPHYFMQMFGHCSPPSLIRFLSGGANWRDRLNVILSVPSVPMLKHLMLLRFIR